MKKVKLFVDNMIFFGIGGIISKLIPLIMVPVITRLLPDTTYYGLSDLCSTMISFGSALAVMGMYDAMFRLFFDREEDVNYQKKVCSTAFLFTNIMAVIILLIMVTMRKIISEFVFGDANYSYLVILAAFGAALTASNTIISAPTRMQNKRFIYLAVNTLTPLVSYSIAIPLILKGYYIIAIPVSTIFADTVVVVSFLIINNKWFALKEFDKRLLKPLLHLAVPLFPTFLIYWIFNSSDKLMISNLLNIAQVGIYTAGSKLGHCSQIIYLAFSGGWSYFAFRTMNDDNQVKTRSLIFEYLGVLSFSIGFFIFALSKTICKVLYVGDYTLGYKVAPYLFLAPLMQMLFQVAANQFTIIKKTWFTTFALLFGALLNIMLNMFLIPIYGIEGAAIASLLGYTVSTLMAVIILWNKKLIRLSLRFFCVLIISIIYIILWRIIFINNVVLSLIVAIMVLIIFINMYKKDFINLILSLKAN